MWLPHGLNVASPTEVRAYFRGAFHDGCYSRTHGTFRISQKESEWVEMLATAIRRLGRRAWVYEEGRRGVHVVESCLDLSEATLDSEEARRAYARGYFDAEGGVPRDPGSRFYVQFVQKNIADLAEVRELLVHEGIACGRLHNPSVRIDPHYWRFYVSAGSWSRFAERIGSWHPRKQPLLAAFLRKPSTSVLSLPYVSEGNGAR